jgi:hypothetical protein
MLLTQSDAPLSTPRESDVNGAASADGEGALTSRLLQAAIHALERTRPRSRLPSSSRFAMRSAWQTMARSI